jgi:hypothetical protein
MFAFEWRRPALLTSPSPPCQLRNNQPDGDDGQQGQQPSGARGCAMRKSMDARERGVERLGQKPPP